MAGGVGVRRGRRDAQRLRVGDSPGFWRVEEIGPGRLLRLRAESRLPGLARLEMYAGTDAEGRTRHRQRALFPPHGLLGHVCRWGVPLFHAVVFGGMARDIAQAAVASARAAPPGALTSTHKGKMSAKYGCAALTAHRPGRGRPAQSEGDDHGQRLARQR